MTSATRVPNLELRSLMTEAGWTGPAFARAINGCAHDIDFPLHCDRTSVAHWLAGRRPRPPVPGLIAEALSRRLGRTVPPDAIGLGDAPEPIGCPSATMDLPGELAMLYADNLTSRTHARSGVYRIAAVSIPDWPNLGTCVSVPSTRHSPDTSPVQLLEAMVTLFHDADRSFGGGYARRPLAGYLTDTVAPLLRESAQPKLRHHLLSAATQLTYLCGYMCFDDELHAQAQRYYTVALHLAQESGDRAAAAMVLSILGRQADWLGHHASARDLAERAVALAGTSASPRTRALVLGHAAAAAAGVGDQLGAQRFLTSARALLDDDGEPPPLPSPDHRVMYAAMAARVHFHLSDLHAERRYLESTVQRCDVTERRHRALWRARLVDVYLERGEISRALSAWQLFLDDLPYLRSARTTKAAHRLRSNLGTHLRRA